MNSFGRSLVKKTRAAFQRIRSVRRKCCFWRPDHNRTTTDPGLNLKLSYWYLVAEGITNRRPPVASLPLNLINTEVVVNSRINSPSDPDPTSASVPAAAYDDYAASNGDSPAALVIPDNGMSVISDDSDDDFYTSALFTDDDDDMGQMSSGSSDMLETSSPDSSFSSISTDEDMDSEDCQSEDFGPWQSSYPADDLDSEIAECDWGLSLLFSCWSLAGDLDTEEAEWEEFVLSRLTSQSREKRVTLFQLFNRIDK